MITPADAEKLATKIIQDYVSACGCANDTDVGNVLMKLLSTTGQALIAVEGQEIALMRFFGTGQHLAKPEFAKAWKRSTVQ